MNTSKMYLQVEQFSLETGRKKDSWTTKAVRSTYDQEGKRIDWVRTCVSQGEDSEKKGDCRYPPWGVSGLSHPTVLVLGSYAEETRPLGWLECSWDK